MKHDAIVTQPVVDTDRFMLRPLRRSDKGLIELHAGDLAVARMTTSIPHPLPPGMTEAYIERALSAERTEDVWAIDGTKDGGEELMGVIGLKRLSEVEKQCEVGFWVAPAFWNTGLASAAVQALIDANPCEHGTMFASVFQDNPASARVLTHCGFQYLGDAESYSVARQATVPTWTYSRKMK
ncbi:Protein N-acetyltransferase, RimJ/RimL family [Salinihabitans flavidus]|uniref:Protein N-acetyltransferase, RimJ/RimL family n=1 Tax=Salinihabitans flavidus TaxID=569882 RepID=A0A1H8VCE0_9RHOB|nr:GNAT family N-acetyltransferase [Salinihabitans flavidus]SEP12548.1 Protein N-acetyltransferase, RimJ/RimL family [Salinihabitans flavidus]